MNIYQERVTYNKEVQTMQTETETQTPSEDDIRERLLREREAAEAEEREKQLEEESLLLDKEIEQEIRGTPVCKIWWFGI